MRYINERKPAGLFASDSYDCDEIMLALFSPFAV